MKTAKNFPVCTGFLIGATVCAIQVSANQTNKALGQESQPYYTTSRVPGNGQNGVDQLKRVYNFVQKYRELHDGAYPPEKPGLVNQMLNKPQDYGFDSIESVTAALSNPDDQYDDAVVVYKQLVPQGKLLTVVTTSSRPDRSTFSGAKVAGTKDVLAFTSTYYHENAAWPVAQRPANPVGFYLALQDDGDVAQVPYDQVFFVYSPPPDGKGLRIQPAFPNQAGVPSFCMSYEEYRTLNRPNYLPPIGTRVPQGKDLPFPDNGAIESLVILSRLLSTPLDRPDVWKSFDETRDQFSLEDTRAAAAKLKLGLELKALSLDELQKLQAPAIFRTSDDKRVVTLSQLDDKEAIVIDRGLTRIVPRDLLALRYGGQALVAASALAPAANAPQVLADDAVRPLSLTSPEQAVTQTVKITNAGGSPLTLQIERPIPGCDKAELSASTIAPGASATLSLSLRWRSVLKSPTQNVLVFLATNDPRRPRLPLGFKLSLPAAPAATP